MTFITKKGEEDGEGEKFGGYLVSEQNLLVDQGHQQQEGGHSKGEELQIFLLFVGDTFYFITSHRAASSIVLPRY